MPKPKKGERTPGSGRGKGTPNKSTELEKQLRERVGLNLVEFWATALGSEVGEIAKELDCQPYLAMKVKSKIAADAAPYVVRRLPQAVEVGGSKDLPPVQVETLTAEQAREILSAHLGAIVVGSPDDRGA